MIGCGGVGLNVLPGHMKKKLKLDEMITRTYPLEDVNAAMVALERGEGVRRVLVM